MRRFAEPGGGRARRPVSTARRSGPARRRLLLPLLLLIGLGGCVSEEQEQRLGDAIATDINQHVPLVHDPLTVLYVNQLGLRVAQHSERPEVPYRFYVINSGVVNAFALPGGHVYVTRGLIHRTEDAAELAAVLAHEVGHVAARHGAQALERELRTGSVVSMLFELLFGAEPAILEQRALRLGGKVWFASHSRRAEREADRLAVRYLVDAGIDPDGMLTMLEGLMHEEAQETGHQAVEWFSTHPTTQERLRLLRRKVEGLDDAVLADLERDHGTYPAFLQRLASLPPPPFAFPPALPHDQP